MKRQNYVIISLFMLAFTFFLACEDNQPIADFTIINNNCEAPCEVGFSNFSTNADAFSWDFGDGNSSTLSEPTNEYTEAGTYTVTLSAFNGLEVDNFQLTVTVTEPALQASFTSDSTSCTAPCSIQFTNTSIGATSYQWDFGNGITSTQTSPSHSYTQGGNYIVKLKAFNGNLVDSTQQVISILNPAIPQAVADFQMDQTTCPAPCTIQFTNTSQNADTFEWDFGDNIISRDESPAHNYAAAGIYIVTLKASNANNSDSKSVEITITAPDACVGLVCQNGGTCFINQNGEPECDCPDGYEGVNCEIIDYCFGVTCPPNVTEDSPVYDETDGNCYCYCNPGYEGENCELLSRDKFLGSYYASDVCTSGEFDYEVTITESLDDNAFFINGLSNFDNPPVSIKAILIDSYQFQLPLHVDATADGDRQIQGDTWGSINPDTGIIAVSFSIYFPDGSVDACTTVLQPQ